MVECSKCKKQFEDGIQYCDQCGTPLTVENTAPAAEPVAEETNVKQTTAETVVAAETNGANEKNANEAGFITIFGKKIAKKWALIGGAAALVTILFFVVIIAAIASALGGVSDYTLYFKDNQIFYNDLSDDGGFQVTDKLLENLNNVSGSQLASASSSFGVYFYMTDDGVLFYPDRLENDGGFSLYYRDTTDKDSEPVKVDSEISYYFVSENGKLVTYTKGEDSVLYQYSVKKEDKEKIATNVEHYIVSANGKEIFYIDEEGGIYYKKSNKDKEKLESDVDEVCYINSDLDKFYYIKENALYMKELGEERVKIASDVENDIVVVYESGEVYYGKLPEGQSDSQAVDTGSYYAASSDTVELYYYDGETSVKVSDNVTNFINAESAAVGVYTVTKDEKIVKYVVAGATSTEIEEESVSYIRVADDGKTIYYMVSTNDEVDYADLYQIKIGKNGAEKPTLYDTDVYKGSMKFFDNKNFMYFKDYKSIGGDYSYVGKADLYVNKNKIDYDVYTSNITYIEDSEDIVYFVDWNSEKSYGTLKIYDGEAKKIRDDVHSYNLSTEGEVLYISDFSTKYFKGDLYLYNGKKSEKIDMDVNGIIRIASIYDYYG